MHRLKLVGVALFLFYGLPAQPAQQQLPPVIPTVPQPENGPNLPPEMAKAMQKRANEERQLELKRDTDKLLKLSTELKEYVDKTNENVLSMDVIKKAEEIEKLAHNVKVKMRGDNFPSQ